MPVCSPIPRPEYPRPDRQRSFVEGIDWLNLNGAWQFRFDPGRRGEIEQWYQPEGPTWREQITVPFCWESLAAWGEGDAAGNDNYFSTRVFLDPLSVSHANHRSAPRYEVGWYRREVTVPDTAFWQGKRAILTVGAADYLTSGWCNGIFLGTHEGGYLPLEFDLSSALEQTGTLRAVLVLRVEDPMDNREQPVGKQWGWYTPTSGIWQTVFIEPRAVSYVAQFRIIPDIDAARVYFEVECAAIDTNAALTVEICRPEIVSQVIVLKLTEGRARGMAALAPLFLWEPGSPLLYRAIFRLVAGTQSDVVHSYFGMRKIHTAASPGDSRAPAILCLNNQPIYLRGALYQSYHPEGVYTATEASVLRDDISYARAAGFDFLRVHLKLDDPLLLFYADTVGMLLMQDLPNFGEGGDTARGRARFEAMLRTALARDFNHPSIIAWCLFNETWGFGGQTELMKLIAPDLGGKEQLSSQKIANAGSFRWVHEMWRVAKTIDPTRLIEDMSVVAWDHLAAYGHVDTDINSWHFYLDDYEKAKAHIENVVQQTYPGSGFNYVEGHQQTGAPLINSEYGGVGALDGDRDVGWTFKFLTNELRRHGQLSAYIFTQLTDVEWERNGLLNYDRSQKNCGYLPNLVNQGDVLPINAPPISQVAPGETIEVEILSSHFSRRSRDGVTLHWHYTGLDSLGVLHPELARGWAPIAFTPYRVELARRLRLSVPSELMLCTLWVSAVTSEGETAATNFIQHYVASGKPAEREDRGRTLVLRRAVEDWHDASWQAGMSSHEEARDAHCAFGRGTGFFEWRFTDEALARLAGARRVQFLCEVSSNRENISQTDAYARPTEFEMSINGLPVHRAILPNHPHDARGALSYLRHQPGAYGYLMRAVGEGRLLTRIAASVLAAGSLVFRCAVPKDGAAAGGLVTYGADAGRYPLSITVIVEWENPV
jgi:hypothetical protein